MSKKTPTIPMLLGVPFDWATGVLCVALFFVVFDSVLGVIACIGLYALLAQLFRQTGAGLIPLRWEHVSSSERRQLRSQLRALSIVGYVDVLRRASQRQTLEGLLSKNP